MRLSWADPTISDFELFLDAQADARSDAFESQLAKPPKQEAVDAGTRPVEPNFRKSKLKQALADSARTASGFFGLSAPHRRPTPSLPSEHDEQSVTPSRLPLSHHQTL